jgi:hypothetical protein
MDCRIMTRIFHSSPQHNQHACITGIDRKTNRVWYIEEQRHRCQACFAILFNNTGGPPFFHLLGSITAKVLMHISSIPLGFPEPFRTPNAYQVGELSIINARNQGDLSRFTTQSSYLKGTKI